MEWLDPEDWQEETGHFAKPLNPGSGRGTVSVILKSSSAPGHVQNLSLALLCLGEVTCRALD